MSGIGDAVLVPVSTFKHHANAVMIFPPVLLLLLMAQFVNAADDEVSARDFMNAWVESYNSNDPEMISQLYEKGDEVEMLVSRGMTLRGHKQIADSYSSDMKAVRFYASASRNMRIRVLNKIALVSFIHRFKYEITADDHRQVQVRTTMALKRSDEGWRIVQEHSSAIHGVEREKRIGSN